MFVETIEQRVRLVRPRSFAGLMTLYESNHSRLRQLLGNLRRIPSDNVSSSPADLPLHLHVTARSRYTSDLHMTYWFQEHDRSVADPDLLLRIYHDARLVEALSCADAPRHAVLRDLWRVAVNGMEQRWNLNILLNKWLEFCLDNRHAFRPFDPRPST